jgi:hypothetical protein
MVHGERLETGDPLITGHDVFMISSKVKFL